MQLRNLIEKSGQKVGITFLYLSTYRYNRSVTTEWAGGQLLSRILADTLTLFQLGRTHYAHHIIPPPSCFQTFLRPCIEKENKQENWPNIYCDHGRHEKKLAQNFAPTSLACSATRQQLISILHWSHRSRIIYFL